MAGNPKSLLDLPAREVLARIAGNQLDAASRGLARLQDPGDPKGLHAFRVAIRRLRSLLRAYRPWMGRVAGRKVRRRLRDLTLATNDQRDADVQIGWLFAQRKRLAANELPGYSWMLRRLRDRKRRAHRSAGRELGRDFADIVRMMGNRLDDAEGPESRSFRDAFLELLGPGIDGLRQSLDAITGADDEESVHRSRIRIKRLRYLIEPLRRESEEARAAVRQLKELQALLGELHDMHVLEDELGSGIEEAAMEKARRLHQLALSGDEQALSREQRRDERPGLVALAARARQRRDALYAEFERGWDASRRRALQWDFDALRMAVAPARTRIRRPRRTRPT